MKNYESGGMRIVAKEGSSINISPQGRKGKSSFGATNELTEIVSQFIANMLQIWVAIRYQFQRITFGVFSKTRIPILKISILIIIIAYIFKKETSLDLHLSAPTPIFASEKQIKEKNYGIKTAGATKPATFDGVSYDLSPASSEELRVEQVRSYIDRFSKIAVVEMDKHGIPASISMAQGIIESRAGLSVLAQRNGNHFGIKCFLRNCPVGHCTNYTDDNHKDFFRKYANSWESWKDHSGILMKGHFKSLVRYGKDYKSWAVGLRQYGYATDPTYDKKLISIIEKYQLYKLDDL